MNQVRRFNWGKDEDALGPRNYFRETLIVQNLQEFIKKGVILDAGCGGGTLAIRLAEKGYKVFCIDDSFESIGKLKEKIKLRGLEKFINVQKGSILKLPYTSEMFDGIVCGEVLEHIDNDEIAIGELGRVLKSKGVCVASVPAKMNKWDIVDFISDHKRRYSKEELTIKFLSAKFKVLKGFYYGFPLSDFWHRYFFIPYLLGKCGSSMEKKVSKPAVLKYNSERITKILSYLFYLDKLFTFTNLGNGIIFVTKKK